eukprot:TCALIF_10755-PA protein Name:"Protein of unknown function" AED:0.19 eAED:0.19 QI:0/0/0/1/1/1/2/0/149
MLRILEDNQMARRHLRDYELWTIFCEITGMLNARPFTYESSDKGDPRVLTPNHFGFIQGVVDHISTWRTGTVEDVHPGVDGLFWAITVKTAEGLVQRTIIKICLLLLLKQMQPSGNPLPRGMGGGMDQRLGVSSGALEDSAGLGPPEHA